MKKKSINLKNVSGILTGKEMKSITGGNGEGGKFCFKCWVSCDQTIPYTGEDPDTDAETAFEILAFDCGCGFAVWPC